MRRFAWLGRDPIWAVPTVVFMLATAAGIVYLVSRPGRVEHTTTTTPATIIVQQPPRTPLSAREKRRAHRTGAGRSPDSTTRPGISGRSPSSARNQTPPRVRHVAPTRRTPTAPPRKRRPAPQRPAPPDQSSGPTPAQRPPLDVQIPAPVTVCVRPAGGVNCQ